MKFKETCLRLIFNWSAKNKNKSQIDKGHDNNLIIDFISKQLEYIQEDIKRSNQLEDDINLSTNITLIYYQCIPLHILTLCIIARKAAGLFELFDEIKNIVISNFYGVFIDSRLIKYFFTHAEETILCFLKSKIANENEFIKIFSIDNIISHQLFALVNILFKIQHLVINCRSATQRVNAIVELCRYSENCLDKHILNFNRMLVDYLATKYSYNDMQRHDIAMIMPLLLRNDQNISDSAVMHALSKLTV